MHKTKGILLGVTIGTVVGAVVAALYPKRKKIMDQVPKATKMVRNQFKNAVEYFDPRAANIYFRKKKRANFWNGTIIGLLGGIGTALLLAKKKGKALTNHLLKAYSNATSSSNVASRVTKASHRNRPKVLQKSLVKKKPQVTKKKVVGSPSNGTHHHHKAHS